MKITYELTPQDLYAILKSALPGVTQEDIHIIEQLPRIITVTIDKEV